MEGSLWDGYHDGLKMFLQVEAVVRSNMSVAEGMKSLLDFCEERLPDPSWEQLRAVDWERDIPELERWLDGLLVQELVPETCQAFYFGLAQCHDPEGTEDGSLQFLFLGGTDQFDINDPHCEWAVGLAYSPQDQDAPSESLIAISRRMQGRPEDVRDIGEYVLGLGFAGLAVKHLCKYATHSLLGTLEKRGVAVGFVEGDGLTLGFLTCDGWIEPDAPREFLSEVMKLSLMEGEL